MSNILFKIIIGLFLVVSVSACNKKPKLNIPDTAPPSSLKTEITPEAMVRMAGRLEAVGDLEGAGNLYTDALDQDRELIEAHLGLGRVLSKMGQDGLAAISYGNAFNLDNNNFPALKGYLQGLLAVDGQDQALAAIGKYLKKNSPNPELLNFQAIAYDLSGNFKAAEAAFREGLQLTTPGDAWNGRLLGNLALSMGLSGDTSAAILLLNPYIGDMRLGRDGISPFQSSLRQNLALVYALAGNPDSAVEVAKSALAPEAAEYNRTFYEAIAALTGPARVRAVFLGKLPAGSQ